MKISVNGIQKERRVDREYRFVRGMTVRYMFVLGLLAALAVSGYSTFLLFVAGQENSGLLVNISGKQRMLSQRVALMSKSLVDAREEGQRHGARKGLLEVTALMERHHKALTKGDPELLGAQEEMSPEIRSLYFGPRLFVDRDMRYFLDAAWELAQTPDDRLSTENQRLHLILGMASDEFLTSLDAIVEQYQKESEETTQRLHYIAIVGVIFSLLVIFCSVFIVFRPLVRSVKQEMEGQRKARIFLRGILETVAEGIIVLNEDGIIHSFNPAAEDVFGYSEDEVIGESIKILLPYEYPAVNDAKANVALPRSIKEPWTSGNVCELQGRKKDGASFPAEIAFSRMRRDDQIVHITAVRDITVRKKAEHTLRKSHENLEKQIEERTRHLQQQISERIFSEKELRKSEERFRVIVETSPVGIAITRFSDGTILFCNDQLGVLYGMPANKLIGRNITEFYVDTSERQKLLEMMHEEGEVRNLERRFKRDDGFNGWCLISSRFIDHGNEKCRLTAAVDITERKETQNQLIQASKLATLGEMATGIAHELNQPLNIIRMAAESSREWLDGGKAPDEFLPDKLDRIISQADRAGAIIDHLRLFGRKSPQKTEKVDLLDTLRETVGFVGEQLRLREIDILLELPETCRKVKGHKIQIEQVILNILTNARDAIEAKQNDDGNNARRISVRLEEDPSADHVKLVIQDTGCGMPKDVLDRVFDPFFTTKDVGRGTGLGLSVSYSIVKETGGAIEAANNEGGAQFTVTLPVAEGAAETVA